MKTRIFIIAAIVVSLALMASAIVVSDNRSGVDNPQVISLKEQLRKSQVTLKQHDSVNNATVADDAKIITELTNQKIILCNQIKTTKLVQPLCK